MAREQVVCMVLVAAVALGAVAGCQDNSKNAFTFEIDVADFGIGTTIYVDGRAEPAGVQMGAARDYSFVEHYGSYDDGVKGFATRIESRDDAMAQIGYVDVKPGACRAECSDAGAGGCDATPIVLEKIAVTATVQGPVTVDPTMTHCEWTDGVTSGP